MSIAKNKQEFVDAWFDHVDNLRPLGLKGHSAEQIDAMCKAIDTLKSTIMRAANHDFPGQDVVVK